MHSSQPESDTVLCACGRPSDGATVTTYRSIHGTYRYHRCPCGMEWTEHDPHPDLSSAVTGDEVIEGCTSNSKSSTAPSAHFSAARRPEDVRFSRRDYPSGG